MNCKVTRSRSLCDAIRALACILAVACPASTRGDETAGLTTIAKWDFGNGEDLQSDGWPDGWSRRKDAKHPGFIPIGIQKKSAEGVPLQDAEQFRRWVSQIVLGWRHGRAPWTIIPEAIPPQVDRFVEKSLLDPYLAFDMDGSAAEVLSPMIPVHEDSLYGLQLDIRSNSPEYQARAQLRFLDVAGNRVFTTETYTINPDDTWKTVRTQGALSPRVGFAFVQVALMVQAESSRVRRGSIGFDRIRVVEMPRIDLQLGRTSRIYRPGETIDVHLLASGLKQDSVRVALSLLDHNGETLECESKELSRISPSPLTGGYVSAQKSRWQGNCEWQLPHLGPGYYELVVQMKRVNAVVFERREHLAVMPELQGSRSDPRLGWTLDESVYSWQLDELLALVREGAAGQVKLPIWFDADNILEKQRVCETIDRLQSAGIHCVGVVHRPLARNRSEPSAQSSALGSSSLEDPDNWRPGLEPVFREMCIRLVDFQIGFDKDTQYSTNPRFATSISLIKNILKRYGSEPSLSIARNLMLAAPSNPDIDRWQWSSEPQWAESEWPANTWEPGMRYPDWTSIQPLPAGSYSLATRVQDLTSRILASIRLSNTRSSTAWISDPFSDETGFLTRQGAPREMFLPYRTLADTIRGKEVVGELDLVSGSRNALVSSDDASSLIVWSAKPVVEQLYLGESVEAIDLWGRPVSVDRIETPFGPEHRFRIDKWPVVLKGVDAKAARWRMGLSLEAHRLDSLVGQSQEVRVTFHNPFPFSVAGKIELISPQALANGSESSLFDAEPNSNSIIPINVMLRPDATAQDTEVRILATINGSPPTRISVVKTLRIGNDDVEFESSYQISDADELWLDIDAINHIDVPVSFDCQLFVPGRRNERVQISNVVDRKTRTIVLPSASELKDQTLWLRCQQIGTRRILNYRIRIEPESLNAPDHGD
jgi:hypothetical protein